MKYSMIISNLLQWVSENPAGPIKSFVSLILSSKVMAKASDVTLLGLYSLLLRILENNLRSIFA